MELALFSTGSGVKTKQATRRWRAHLPLARLLPFLLLPLALRASAVTTVQQLYTLFCNELPSCLDYPVLPPDLPPIPEAPGYTLGPYIPVLYFVGPFIPGVPYMDRVEVAYYPGTILQFLSEELGASYGSAYGYAGFAFQTYDGYLFQMNAAPELISSIVPEPSSVLFVALGVALIGARHLWSGCKTGYCSKSNPSEEFLEEYAFPRLADEQLLLSKNICWRAQAP